MPYQCFIRCGSAKPVRNYYEAVRPSPAHRYFRPRGWSRVRLFPWPRRQGSPVPYDSLVELRATYTPDAARSVSGHPPSSSRRKGHPAILTSSYSFRRFISGSLAFASLDRACRSHSPDVSVTLTTTAFDRSSSRWLGISDLIAEPEGPSFISRTVARNRLDRLRS